MMEMDGYEWAAANRDVQFLFRQSYCTHSSYSTMARPDACFVLHLEILLSELEPLHCLIIETNSSGGTGRMTTRSRCGSISGDLFSHYVSRKINPNMFCIFPFSEVSCFFPPLSSLFESSCSSCSL